MGVEYQSTPEEVFALAIMSLKAAAQLAQSRVHKISLPLLFVGHGKVTRS